jgi:hypothetical protein
VEAGAFGGEPLAPVGVAAEEVAQMDIAHLCEV